MPKKYIALLLGVFSIFANSNVEAGTCGCKAGAKEKLRQAASHTQQVESAIAEQAKILIQQQDPLALAYQQAKEDEQKIIEQAKTDEKQALDELKKFQEQIEEIQKPFRDWEKRVRARKNPIEMHEIPSRQEQARQKALGPIVDASKAFERAQEARYQIEEARSHSAEARKALLKKAAIAAKIGIEKQAEVQPCDDEKCEDEKAE